MMIRSCSITPVLDRICSNGIQSALLVTYDGELLGASTSSPPMKNDPESFGTLVADIAVDYLRLGEEFAAIDAVQRSRSTMNCLLMELDQGLVGVSCCGGASDCFVIAIADHDAPPGLVKARLQELAVYVQESLSTLTEAT